MAVTRLGFFRLVGADGVEREAGFSGSSNLTTGPFEGFFAAFVGDKFAVYTQ